MKFRYNPNKNIVLTSHENHDTNSSNREVTSFGRYKKYSSNGNRSDVYMRNKENDKYSDFVQVRLDHRIDLKEHDLMKITRETLTRMGIESPEFGKKELCQICHLISDGNRYFVCHYKEIFKLGDQDVEMKNGDYDIRDAIIRRLVEWNFIEVVGTEKYNLPKETPTTLPLTILQSSDKKKWNLVQKVYNTNM